MTVLPGLPAKPVIHMIFEVADSAREEKLVFCSGGGMALHALYVFGWLILPSSFPIAPGVTLLTQRTFHAAEVPNATLFVCTCGIRSNSAAYLFLFLHRD